MKQTLRQLRGRLREIYPAGEAEAIIRLMFEYLKGWSPVDIVLHEDEPLSDFMKGKVEGMLSRLMNHEPIQYIVGKARFYGMEFDVTPAVLIPRPETEELVEHIVEWASEAADLRVLDAGTGSGCIAVALARNLRFPEITAIDISSEALQVAQGNARKMHCHIRFERCDMLHLPARKECWDVIVSNPPYIAQSEAASMEDNVLDYEPHAALFVPDDDPLRFYTALAEYGRNALSEGGTLWFEINPHYASVMVEMLQSRGYVEIECFKDIHGRERFVRAMQRHADD